MNFDQAVEIIIKHEGGYIAHPLDPGGETKYGISKKSYPHLDIKLLTVEKAKVIYKEDFWNKCEIDKLPEKVRLMFFDCAVNQGPRRAREFYDQSKGIAQSPETILARFANIRMNHYTSLPGWKTFGAGWSKRLLDVTLRSFAEF